MFITEQKMQQRVLISRSGIVPLSQFPILVFAGMLPPHSRMSSHGPRDNIHLAVHLSIYLFISSPHAKWSPLMLQIHSNDIVFSKLLSPNLICLSLFPTKPDSIFKGTNYLAKRFYEFMSLEEGAQLELLVAFVVGQYFWTHGFYPVS